MSRSAIPATVRSQVAARDDGKCRYCTLRQTGQAGTFHVDHIVPRSGGGATTLDNLALQCPWCSLHKSNKTAAIDPETGEMSALFHPLQQVWADHFSLTDDGTCNGLSSIGKATVLALRMNDSLPKTARALQRALGII